MDEINENKKKNKKSDGIDPFVLMFIIIVIVTILSYVLPAGQYEREEVDGQTVIDPETFEFVESSPVGVVEMYSDIHEGMIEGSPIILFVFMFGGALGIMQKTGAIDSFIKATSIRFRSHEKLFITFMTLIFAFLGTLIGSAEDALVYIAIVVPMVISLGFDAITGFAIVMLGVMATGFTSGITNPFNVGVAQEIAELPVFSGMYMRVLYFIIMLVVTIIYIYKYAMKVKREPELAVYGNFEKEKDVKIDNDFVMSKKHFISLIIFLLTFLSVIIGVIKFDWFISEIGGMFILGGIFMCIFCFVFASCICHRFINGLKDMAEGAMIIGVAYTILVVLESGLLLD